LVAGGFLVGGAFALQHFGVAVLEPPCHGENVLELLAELEVAAELAVGFVGALEVGGSPVENLDSHCREQARHVVGRHESGAPAADHVVGNDGDCVGRVGGDSLAGRAHGFGERHVAVDDGPVEEEELCQKGELQIHGVEVAGGRLVHEFWREIGLPFAELKVKMLAVAGPLFDVFMDSGGKLAGGNAAD
jgi:hypothetical protein